MLFRSVQGLAERLLRQHGPIRLLDARRPRLGHIDDPLPGAGAAPSPAQRWAAPLTAMAGVSSLLVLAD